VRKLKEFGLAALMAGTMVVGLASAASASNGRHLALSSAAGARIAGPQINPNVNIKLNGHGVAKFKPKRVTAPRTVGTCTPTNYSFSVTNTTSSTQQLTYDGSDLGSPILSGQNEEICTPEGTFVIGLTSSTKTLTATIT
jgi:hypothetical protein